MTLRLVSLKLRHLQKFAPLTILPVLYVCVAWGHWGIHRSELFPFAPWSMFNNVPNSVTRYTLLVEPESNEKSTEAKPIWEFFPDGVKALPLPIYRAQAKLGMAVEASRTKDVAVARQMLSKFLRSRLGSGDAVLVKEVFDPAKMYTEGTTLTNEELLRLTF